MPVVGATRVWAVDEILSAANMNTYLSNPIDDTAGRDGRQDLEDSLTIQDGSSGNRYIGLPKGTTGQRPTIPSGLVLLRYNTSTNEPEVGEGSGWSGFATSGVTFEALNANSDVGTGSSQVAAGDHSHPISSFGIDELEVEDYDGQGTVSVTNSTFTNVRDIDVTFNASEVGVVIRADVQAIGGGGPDFDVRLVRGATQIGNTISITSPGESRIIYLWVFSDTSPPDGDKTYTMQVRRGSGLSSHRISTRNPVFVALGVG